MIIVAHRGASVRAPENTTPAFELAWKEGADAIEGDFRVTKDGHIICVHDQTTGRVAGVSLDVHESTLSELKSLDPSAGLPGFYGKVSIPTIDEVFRIVPKNKKIFVEIKDDERVFPGFFDEVERSGLEYHQIIVISYNSNVIRIVKSAFPRLKAFLIVKFQKNNPSEFVPSCDRVLKTMAEIKADGLSCYKANIDRALVTKITESGYEFHVWTVDEPELGAQFLEWGAESVTTNVPGYLRKQLEKLF